MTGSGRASSEVAGRWLASLPRVCTQDVRTSPSNTVTLDSTLQRCGKQGTRHAYLPLSGLPHMPFWATLLKRARSRRHFLICLKAARISLSGSGTERLSASAA